MKSHEQSVLRPSTEQEGDVDMGLPSACPQASGRFSSVLARPALPLSGFPGLWRKSPVLHSQGEPQPHQLHMSSFCSVNLLPIHPPSGGILCCPPAAPLECTGRWGDKPGGSNPLWFTSPSPDSKGYPQEESEFMAGELMSQELWENGN